MRRGICSWGIVAVFLAVIPPVLFAQDLILTDLIATALQNSPEIRAAEARATAMSQKVFMEGSLMDPMLSLGYQNEGLKEYNYGETPDAQWMFSLEQTFPWPGTIFSTSSFFKVFNDSIQSRGTAWCMNGGTP